MAVSRSQQIAAVAVVAAQALALGDAGHTYAAGAVALLALTRGELLDSWAISGALAIGVTLPITLVYHTLAAAAVAAHVACKAFGRAAPAPRETRASAKAFATKPQPATNTAKTTTKLSL